MLQIVDVVPAVIGNVFARAVAHEWQVSNSSHQNGNGHMISQNGNSTAVSNSVSSSKGRLSLELKSTICVNVLYIHNFKLHQNKLLLMIFSCQRF